MSEHPHRHARLAAGFPAGAALLWGVEGLARGGLAPIVVAVATSMFVAAPLAERLWRRAEVRDDRMEALATSAQVCAAIVVAALAARVAPDTSQGTAVGLILLVCAAWLPRLRSGLAWPVGFLGALAALATSEGSPWSLLQPGWSAWPDWLALAYGSGFLLAGMGFGAWSLGGSAVPGFRKGPWVSAGMAALTLLACSLVWASVYEANLGSLGPLSGPLPWLLVVATCTGWADQSRLSDPGHLLGLCLAFVWLNSGLAPDPEIFWPLVLLLPGLLASGLLVSEAHGPDRLVAGLPGVLGVVVLAVAWPGFGSNALAASTAMVPVLAVAWAGGTRLIVGRA